MSKKSQRDRKAQRHKERDAQHRRYHETARPLAQVRNTGYAKVAVDLSTAVNAPSYQVIMDWMQTLSGRSASFDIWARGNFTRRLLHHRQTGVQPILVRVESVDEIRWAYRRLALMGLPVDFIYAGSLGLPQRLLHLYPYDAIHDCGWGYTAALGSVATINDRRWFPLHGTARLMPDRVVDWIVEEARIHFLQGLVFVAPADLVGLDSAGSPPQMDTLTQVSKGTSTTTDVAAARLMLNVEMPFVDGMAPNDFQTFLGEYGDELTEFREAFKELFGKQPISESRERETFDRIAHEVSELTCARRHRTMWTFIGKCGGSLKTFPFGIAALGGLDAIYNRDPIAGVASIGVAADALWKIWKESKAQELNSPGTPYRILLRLGMEKIKYIPRAYLGDYPKRQSGSLGPCHWLCPPTNGIGHLMRKK